jgi:hypothetical protein
MQSKNKKAPTVAEAAHIERVKELTCSVCDANGKRYAKSIGSE